MKTHNKITFASALLYLVVSVLLTGCGESAADKEKRERAEKEALALSQMPPDCNAESTMKSVRYLIKKFVDPFEIGKNKQYSGITETQRLLDLKERRCRARLTYDYVGKTKSHYLEYSIYWLDDAHKRFQVEMTTITNNH